MHESAAAARFGLILGNPPVRPSAGPPRPPTPRREAATPKAHYAGAKVVRLVNRVRVGFGLVPLEVAAGLHSAALAHAWDMARRDFFAHDNPDGENPGVRVARAGYDADAWGENIAVGQLDAETVMRDWMNSEGHRANILNHVYTQIGVAMVIPGRDSRPLWVQVFGTPA